MALEDLNTFNPSSQYLETAILNILACIPEVRTNYAHVSVLMN